MEQCTQTPETVLPTNGEKQSQQILQTDAARKQLVEEKNLQEIEVLSELAQITEFKILMNGNKPLSTCLLLAKFYHRLQDELYVRNFLALDDQVPLTTTYPYSYEMAIPENLLLTRE